MRWTPHMDECLHRLASEPGCENDEILVMQTKCARLLDDICSSSSCAFRSDGADGRDHERISTMLLVKALNSHLGEVRSHIRPPLLENRETRPPAMFEFRLTTFTKESSNSGCSSLRS